MSKSIEDLVAEVERTDDRATYMVLADALVESGDARGELMNAQLALDDASVESPLPWPLAFRSRTTFDRAREDRPATVDRAAAVELRRKASALIDARTAELFAGLPTDHGFKAAFRYGFLDKLSVGFSVPHAEIGNVLAQIFASPEARLLRIVELDPSLSFRNQNWFQKVFADIAARALSAPASLKTIACGSLYPGTGYQYSPGEDPGDDLSGVLAAFPTIEELWIQISALEMNLPSFVSTKLRHLTYMTPSISTEELNALGSAELPALESFVVWTGAAHYVNEKADMTAETPGRSVALTDLEPVFAMLDRCPELRTLGIANYADDVAALVAAIAAHPVGGRIERLDLSYLDKADGTSLGPALDKLPALREVIIEGSDATSKAWITMNNRTLNGGFTYDLPKFRYVMHQE